MTRNWVAIALAFLATVGLCRPAAAQPLYFASDGSALNASRWSASPGGPFDQPFAAGSIATFAVPAGTGTGASIVVGGITATENFTLTGVSGTISNQGNGVVTLSVVDGKTLDFSTQSFTSSMTAGYVKIGTGVVALAGNTYQGGFTLNEGTVIVRGINAMGGGAANTLTINGGTIAANATRDLSGKYGGGIAIGGDFTLGATTGLANTAANLTFSNAVNLGGATRTVTVGGSGFYRFTGGMSNGGLTVAATNSTGVLVLGGTNTYTGGTNVLSGAQLQIELFGGGSLAGDVTNSGELSFAGGVSYGGVISGTGSVVKLSGNVTLSGANTYTGKTVVGGSADFLTVASLANGGQVSNIGASTKRPATNLVITGGTLNYTGSGVTTDRLFSVGAASESHLASSGTGPLVFANIGQIGYEGTFGNRALYLEGTNSGANVMALKLVDAPDGTLSVRKMGSGTWTLTGDNTCTGLTAALQGTLLVNGSMGGTVGASISQEARLGGSGTIGGGVFVQAGNVIQRGARLRGGEPGTTGTLTFSGGSTVAANTTTSGGLPNGGGLEVEVSRTGGDGTVGTADASRVVFGGPVNFNNLAAGTPTAGSPKFVIEVVGGTNPLQAGESYTIVLLTASEIRRNGVRVGEFSTYTFDPNDYVLMSNFGNFDSASLQVVGGNTLQLTFSPVPEPTTVLAIAAGGLIVGTLWRRRLIARRSEMHNRCRAFGMVYSYIFSLLPACSITATRLPLLYTV